MEIKSYLSKTAKEKGFTTESLIFPDCDIAPENVKVIMIDEAPPKKPEDDFYSKNPKSSFVRTTLGLFKLAGVDVKSVQDILDMGIYITTALKIPRDKTQTLKADEIKAFLPILEDELALFPNLKVIMLMGGTAIKAMNYIAKARAGKNIIPTGDTYKIRNNVYEWQGKRVFPSAMMSNRTILSDDWALARDNTVDDIRQMILLIKE
jgi:hypothetical protein